MLVKNMFYWRGILSPITVRTSVHVRNHPSPKLEAWRAVYLFGLRIYQADITHNLLSLAQAAAQKRASGTIEGRPKVKTPKGEMSVKLGEKKQ